MPVRLLIPLLLLLAWFSLAGAQITEALHPGYSLVNLRPAGFQPKGIGGMDFLPDGTLALCTWGGYQRSEGEVLLVSGAQGSGPEGVTVRTIARGLSEPMGLKVVDGAVYVMQRTELSKITIPAGTALAAPVKVVGGWQPPEGDWTYGLAYQNGIFYGTQGDWNKNANLGKDQGSWLKLTPGKGYQTIAGGLRNPNGIGLGPDGEMFATDNQGTWLPSSKLIHLVPGRSYGYKDNALSPFTNLPETAPAVWVPHGDIGFSPSEPILVPAGVYKGQMLAGDVHFGGIQRYFLERVKAPGGAVDYQGAVFRFTGGLECGVNRLIFGQDGSLYMGGVGGSPDLGDLGGWNWNSKWYGFQKLVPNGKTAFDMLAVRSLTDGFEIEFTQPAAADAGTIGKYTAKHWRYEPTATYGGPKVDPANLAVQSATLSADGKRVRLKIAGLKTGFVVNLTVTGLKSAAGEDLWAKSAWYTLNNFGPAEPTVAIADDAGAGAQRMAGPVRITVPQAGITRFEVPGEGPFTLSIRDAAGKQTGIIRGASGGAYLWKCPAPATGLRFYRLEKPGYAARTGRFLPG
jgi:hypothetical protein